MELEIKGKVSAVLPMVSGTSANGEWKRQVVVIEYQDGSYTRKLAIENAKKADEFAKLNVGDEGVFKCNTPTSREYNGRWYTSVTCWSWTMEESVPQGAPVEPTIETTETPAANGDMPF